MTQSRCWLALACTAGLAPVPAWASGDASCTISATALSFGEYVPSRNGASDFTATIDVTCTALREVPISVNGQVSLIGRTENGRRQLTDGASHLTYQLFLDPARTIAWGDGSGEGQTQTISGEASPTVPLRISVIIYGRILGRQTGATAGSYADVVTALLSY